MKKESVNTADGTTASDPSSLPVPLEPIPMVKRRPSHLAQSRGRTTRRKQLNSSGLSCLDSVDLISIEVDRHCLSCRLDKNFSIRDVTGDKVILKGLQDFHPFNSFDGLKNVILRDTENLPVARVCYKQKSPLYSSMALAVYAPCDVLVGTGEETAGGIFVFSSRLILRNADGDEMFVVEYNNKILSSNYSIKSANEQETEVAKIIEKSKRRIRLQLTSKMNATNQ